jgi:hypothetical protein
MKRISVCRSLLLSCVAGFAAAASLDMLSSKDASQGLRAALSQGIETAVTHLGAQDGFLNNPKVAIPLPPALDEAERALRMVGMSGEADNQKATMNHAAETAVREARPVFSDALRRMTLTDAKAILTGGDTAGTEYFRRATSVTLAAKFQPVVARQTAKLQLAAQYDRFAGKAAELGLISPQDANLNDYVTARALDGLFSTIADEERAIRKDPLGQASTLIKKVFSAVQ